MSRRNIGTRISRRTLGVVVIWLGTQYLEHEQMIPHFRRKRRKYAQLVHEYLLSCLFGVVGLILRLLLLLGLYEAGLTSPYSPFSPIQPANILGCLLMGMFQSTKLTWFARYPIFHAACTSGFCGNFTAFSSWMLAASIHVVIQRQVAHFLLELLFGLSTMLFALFVGYHIGEELSLFYVHLYGRVHIYVRHSRRWMNRVQSRTKRKRDRTIAIIHVRPEEEEEEEEEEEQQRREEEEQGGKQKEEQISKQKQEVVEEKEASATRREAKGKEKVKNDEEGERDQERNEEGREREKEQEEGNEGEKDMEEIEEGRSVILDEISEEEREEVPLAVKPAPALHLLLYILATSSALLGIYILMALLLVFRIEGMRIYVAIMVSPPGTILRHFLVKQNLRHSPEAFPRYTLVANLLGTTLAAVFIYLEYDLAPTTFPNDVYLWVSHTNAWSLLPSFNAGFCGAVTSASTFVNELKRLPTRVSYIYGLVSIFLAQTISALILVIYYY